MPLHFWKNEIRITFMALVMISVITKLFIIIFLLIEDITRIIRWSFQNVKMRISPDEYAPGNISRNEFLSKAALAVGAVPAATFAFGIIVRVSLVDEATILVPLAIIVPKVICAELFAFA